MTVTRTLTHGYALQLGKLLNWINDGKKVRYSLDGGDTIHTGILRHVVAGREQWGFPGNNVEIRDQWVRITGVTGPFDCAYPVDQIVTLMQNDLFVLD